MTIDLLTARRSLYCGDLRAEHIGRNVVLKGWVHHWRDHGGVIFVDLRDREGYCQIVFDPEEFAADKFERASHLKHEDCLAVIGRVRRRPEDTINPNMATGEVEVLLSDYSILSRSEPLPFQIDEHAALANEELRLRHRYIDLRRGRMQRNIRTRAKVARIMRSALDDEGFIEIETPMLTRSTPEGARDFLVPSRLVEGTFYALPQSPQTMKQTLMISGFDRYYQIVRCFRDEDLRANRQPEFTQLDVEMAFVTPDELFEVMERMIQRIWNETLDVELPLPFDRITFEEAMRRYGSDKPDRRFAMELTDLTASIRGGGCEFKVFNQILEEGGAIRALCVKGGGDKYSNTQLKPGGELPSYAERHGAKGLAWFRVVAGEGGAALESSISKFFQPECQQAIAAAAGGEPGDLILIVADAPSIAANALGQLRLKLAKDLGLIPKGEYNFCWVTDFPLFEWSKEDRRWYSMHHPFTMPHYEDLDRLDTAPGAVRSLGYDLALNGEEIAGGSIRIHDQAIQRKVFRLLGIGEEEAEAKFSFLLNAFRFGPPPHGGIAFGFDRMMMLILGEESIRDVIAFPKTQTGTCLLTGAPAEVDDGQLDELRLKSTVKKDADGPKVSL